MAPVVGIFHVHGHELRPLLGGQVQPAQYAIHSVFVWYSAVIAGAVIWVARPVGLNHLRAGPATGVKS